MSSNNLRNNLLIVALIAVIALLSIVVLVEYTELVTVPTYHSHYVEVLSAAQVSLIMNDNAADWKGSGGNATYNFGTFQYSQLNGGAEIGATIFVWGFNQLTYSTSEYNLLPQIGTEYGPKLNNLTTLSIGTLSNSWKYKILGECNLDQGPVLSCDDVGVALKNGYVAYVELYPSGGGGICCAPLPNFSDVNASGVSNLLQAQTSQI